MRRALRGVLAAGLVLAVTESSAAAPTVAYRTTLDGPVTGLPAACGEHRSPSTPQLAADGTRLAVAWFEDGGDAIVVARSGDAGQSWQREAVGPAYACTGGDGERAWGVNPTLALAGDGAPVVGSSWGGSAAGNFAYGVTVHRAEGPSWITAQPEPGYAQDVATVAGTGATVHAAWNHFDQVDNPLTYAPPRSDMRFASSPDGGRTFGPGRTILQGLPGFALDTPRIVRLPDGALLAVIGRTPIALAASFALGRPAEFEILATRSSDGGATWSEPKVVGTTQILAAKDPECADPTPTTVACDVPSLNLDLASGPDGSVAVASSTPNANGTATVRLLRSADGGRTWGAPITAGTSAGNVALPAVAIGQGGRLAVLYYEDSADMPGDAGWTWTVRVATSKDAGATWEASPIDQPFDLRPVPAFPTDGGETGVYQDIQPVPGGFGAVYTVGAPVAADGISDVRFARIVG